MDDAELLEEVRQRWQRGHPPKAIARALGLKPSAVAPLVRQIAAEAQATQGLGTVLHCCVNRGWSIGLGLENHPEWAALDDVSAAHAQGFAQVLVAREARRGRARLYVYLTDVHCLGVKNVHDMGTMDAGRISGTLQSAFSAFDQPPIDIPIELGRELVAGAVHYARELGFEPHADFDADAAAFLGDWEGPGDIEFGNNGKPFYLNGPYDNPRAVLRTLEQSVGAGNFEYSVTAG